MTYLCDSDWVIDFLKGRTEATALFGQLYDGGMAMSIMTFAEVYEGIYYGRDQMKHDAGFRALCRAMRVLGVNRSIARRYARIRGDLRARGLLIPQPDTLIAATALHYDLILVTRNLRDFQRIPNLKTYQ